MMKCDDTMLKRTLKHQLLNLQEHSNFGQEAIGKIKNSHVTFNFAFSALQK